MEACPALPSAATRDTQNTLGVQALGLDKNVYVQIQAGILALTHGLHMNIQTVKQTPF